MSGGTAAVDRHIMSRCIHRGTDLAVAAEVDVFAHARGWLDPVHLQVSRLIVAVDDSFAADVDISGEVDDRADARLDRDLRVAGDRDIAGDVNLDKSLTAVSSSRQG